MKEFFLQHLLGPLAAFSIVAAFPWLRTKTVKGATAAWESTQGLLRRIVHLATAGTKARRDRRFAARVKAVQSADNEMLGDAIDAHGLALSALHTVVATMLLSREVGGKKHLPNHAEMLCWFMLYRYLCHSPDRLDMAGDSKTIAAYLKRYPDDAPGRWETHFSGHSNNRLNTEIIDSMHGGPLRFSREMKDGSTLNVKVTQGFLAFQNQYKDFKCHVWVGPEFNADEGQELGLEDAYRLAKDKLALGGGWKEESK